MKGNPVEPSGVSVVVEDNEVTEETVLLSGEGRIRNVIQGPDGSIYVSVEGPGRIIRITPE